MATIFETHPVKLIGAYCKTGCTSRFNYRIDLRFNGKTYYFYGYNTYFKYHDQLGKMVRGIFARNVSDDGKESLAIVSIEGDAV